MTLFQRIEHLTGRAPVTRMRRENHKIRGFVGQVTMHEAESAVTMGCLDKDRVDSCQSHYPGSLSFHGRFDDFNSIPAKGARGLREACAPPRARVLMRHFRIHSSVANVAAIYGCLWKSR